MRIGSSPSMDSVRLHLSVEPTKSATRQIPALLAQPFYQTRGFKLKMFL